MYPGKAAPRKRASLRALASATSAGSGCRWSFPLEEGRQHDPHDVRQERGPLRGGIRREAVHDRMRRAEDNLLERLVGHRPRLRLEAVRVEHVADARADDPVQLLGFCGHCVQLATVMMRDSLL